MADGEVARTRGVPEALAVAAAAGGAATASLLAAPADLRSAALAGGIVLVAGLLAAAVAVLGRGASGGERGPLLDGATLLAIPALTLVALTAALAGAAALPDDLHLRTLGRPPGLLLPLAGGIALALVLALRALARGAPPARAGLVLLLPLLTLEGLPIGAPPEISLAAAGTLVLLSAGGTGPRATPRVPGLPAIGAFLVALGWSTFRGADPGPGVDVLVRLLALAGAFVVLVTDEEPKAAARLAVRTLLGVVAAVSLFGLVTRFVLHDAVSGLGVDAFGTELSLFGRHPNTLAPWFGAGAVLALPLVLGGRGFDRALAIVTLPLASAALLLTASRLSILAALAAVILISIRRTRLWRGLLRAGAALGVVVLAALLLPAFRDKVLNRELHPNLVAESHRLHRMEVAWHTAADRPWFGHGPKTWFVQGRFVPPSRFVGEDSSDHPHDLPLALLEGSGVVGLALFVVLLVLVLGWSRRALAAEDDEARRLATGVSFALLAQLLTNLLDMGDALDTFVPSRLLIDAGILAALARAAAGPIGLQVPRPALAPGGLVLAAAGTVLGAGAAFSAHGRTLAARGQTTRALETLERAAALRPFDAEVRLALVPVAWGARDVVAARERLEEAEALAGDRPSLQQVRASFLRVSSGDAAALRALERAFALDPRGATGAALAPALAELRIATGDRASGIEAAADAIWEAPAKGAAWIDPARPDVLTLGGVPVPVEELRAALAARVPEGAEDRLRRRLPLREAELFLMLGRTDDAYAALERLSALDGAVGSHQLQFEARIARAAGDLERSRRAAERALAERPHPSLELELGDTLALEGRHEEALAAYRRALALSLDAHFVEGVYQDLLSRLEAELDALGRTRERVEALEHLAFFTAEPLARARTAVRLADARRASEAPDASIEADLLRALSLVLDAGVSEESRAVAADLGRRFAARLEDASSRSRAADDLERWAERRGGGPVLHAFRVALLEGLGLVERAAAARLDLAAER